jgi:hypothetical protein
MIDVFVGFSSIFLLGILIFKGLTARRLYKSFGVKGLMIFDSRRVILCTEILLLIAVFLKQITMNNNKQGVWNKTRSLLLRCMNS